jgi:integrase
MKNDKQKHRYNSNNERMKYKYRIYTKRALKKDAKTIDAIMPHIREYELFVDFRGFDTFNNAVANKYIDHLFNRKVKLSYIGSNIRALKDFFTWLIHQIGYKTKIDYNHIGYLSISNNQRREAKAQSYQKTYNYPEIITVIRAMPNKTEKDKRDKAIVSLQALCTLRVSELRTVNIKNLIEEDGLYFVDVNPKDMSVKFAKTRVVNFIELPNDIFANVIEWRDYLINIKKFKDNDPLFPIIDNRFNQENMLDQLMTNKPIKSDTTMRNVFKHAFECAGMKYINPHSFRKTLARYAQKQSPEFLNAVRQNLGHSSIDTTLSSYGQLSILDQRRIIAGWKLSPE